MTPEQEHKMWRNRFILMNLVRIGGTVLVFFALALWQSDLIVDGGSILGFPLAFVGLVISFFAPKWLAGRWRTPPGP